MVRLHLQSQLKNQPLMTKGIINKLIKLLKSKYLQKNWSSKLQKPRKTREQSRMAPSACLSPFTIERGGIYKLILRIQCCQVCRVHSISLQVRSIGLEHDLSLRWEQVRSIALYVRSSALPSKLSLSCEIRLCRSLSQLSNDTKITSIEVLQLKIWPFWWDLQGANHCSTQICCKCSPNCLKPQN